MRYLAQLTVAFALFVTPLRAAQTSLNGTFPDRPRELYEATGTKFMVASQGEATTLAARKMLVAGGNVVDAAAAASFCISVERPQSTGIAGGGFMLVHLPGTGTLAFDFRERAPAKSTEKMFQDAKGEVVPGKSTEGGLAVGIPGMVAGVVGIHKKYGKLPLAKVMQPAIELAENGFAVYPHLAAALEKQKDVLWKSEAARPIFFKGEGQPLKLGDTLKQADLAKVLKAIAAKGRDGFYKGWVADALVAENTRLGGVITQADLNAYQIRARQPVKDDYGPYDIVSMPPPSSGGTHIVEILNVLEELPLAKQDAYSPESIHSTAAAMQFAYHDRTKYLGDSDFVKVPLKTLTSDAYAGTLRKSIDPAKAKKFTEVKAPDARKESKETTHFTIADASGGVVTSTQTINGWFGSGVVVPGTGMVLNNEMDDFSAKPGVPNKFGLIGGKENAIQAGKRPLSSMSPTIVLKKGKPVLALGSPSGSQIITCVTLTTLNYLTYKKPLYDSVAALRYHHQWTPDQLLVEAPGFPEPVTAELKKKGYDVQVGDIGCKVQAVAFEEGKLRGVSDPRGEGLAIGEGKVPQLQGKYDPKAHVSAD